MAIKILNDQNSGISWAVRLVHRGETFGPSNAMVHEKDDPLVEFFDTRYSHTDLGQFVSAYSQSTLLKAAGPGLRLDTGSPDWQVSAGVMRKLCEWLSQDHRPAARDDIAHNASIELDLNVRAEGIIVDATTCTLTIAQASAIVDQASELVLLHREGKDIEGALAELDGGLAVANVIEAEDEIAARRSRPLTSKA